MLLMNEGEKIIPTTIFARHHNMCVILSFYYCSSVVVVFLFFFYSAIYFRLKLYFVTLIFILWHLYLVFYVPFLCLSILQKEGE